MLQVFNPPDAETGPRTKVSPIEFFNLFTFAEEVAIREFAKGTTPQALTVATMLRRLDDPRMQTIYMTHATTQEGLNGLVALGLLTAERRAVIERGV